MKWWETEKDRESQEDSKNRPLLKKEKPAPIGEEMPAIMMKAKLKGRRGEIEIPVFANSLSDFVIVTGEVIKKINPEPMGFEEELEVAGGDKVRGPAYLIRVKVRDPETKEKREAEVEAVWLKREKVCLLGIEALEKLGISLDMKNGKYKLV